jgi:hypothetical protein
MVNTRKGNLISLRAYARRRGCSPAAVHKAIVSGRIRRIDGKIDAELADREWAIHTNPGQWAAKQSRK